MNRKIILFAFLSLLGNLLFSQTYDFENQTYRYRIYFSDWDNPGFHFSFAEGKLEMDFPELDDEMIENGIYIHETKKDIYELSNQNDFLYLTAFGKKYLLLSYKDLLCVLVDCADYTTYFGINEKSEYVTSPKNPARIRDWWIGIDDPVHYETKISSCLTEGKIKYDNRNVNNWQLKIPWAEGKIGSGIDEWIEKKSVWKTDKIVLLNGYVDPNHPDYFYKNERIKDLEVQIGDKIFSYTLDDSPQLQILELPDYFCGPIRIKIKSVYSGEKNTDTCLSYFLFLDEKK